MGGHCFFVEFFTKWNSNRNSFRLQRNIGCVPGKLREMRRGGQRRRCGHGGLKCRQRIVSLKWVVEEQQLGRVDENSKNRTIILASKVGVFSPHFLSFEKISKGIIHDCDRSVWPSRKRLRRRSEPSSGRS